jgi:PRTRC genetic system protein E
MFSALFPILKKARDVNVRLIIDKDDESKITVVVSPLHPEGKKHSGLSQPVMFKGSPEELDQDFATGMAQITPNYESVSNTVAQMNASLNATKKALDKQSSNGAAQKNKAAGEKPSPKPQAAVQTTISLFGDDDGAPPNASTEPDEGESEVDDPAGEATGESNSPVSAPLFSPI